MNEIKPVLQRLIVFGRFETFRGMPDESVQTLIFRSIEANKSEWKKFTAHADLVRRERYPRDSVITHYALEGLQR